MRSAFKHYKLLKLAMGEEKMPEEGDARDRWIEKSVVLYDLFLQSVNNDMFQHIKDLVELDDSGPKAWKLLRDVIQPNTLPMVIVLEKELTALSMQPGDDVKPVLDKIKDTYARMAAAGSNVSQMQTSGHLSGYGSRFCRRTSTGATRLVVLPTKLLRGMDLQEAAEEEGEGEAEAVGEALDVKGSEADVGSVGKVVMHPLTHWVIDSGCTSHMTPRADLLDEVKPPIKIKFVDAASSALLPVIGVGNAKVMGANGGLVGLGNVLLVEGLSANLLSVRRLQRSKAKLTFDPTSSRAKLVKLFLWDLEEKNSCIKDLWQLPIIPQNGKPPATAAAAATARASTGGEEIAPPDGALDAVKKVQQTQQPHGEVLAGVDATAAWAKASSGSGETDWETWHESLCHVNFPMLLKLVKDGSLKGLEVKGAAKEIGSCPTCLETKFTKFPFSSSTGPAKAPLALVHMDVVYPLKTKGEVAADVLKEWMLRAQRESGHKVKVIRTDNGGEFIGADFEAVLKTKGIQHQLTVLYNPQQIGVAECFNRTLQEGARTLLGRAGLPDPFWVTALRQVALVKNRVLTTVGDKRDMKFLGSLYYKEWKQQQQKLPTTPLIIEADEVQRPFRQVQVTVSEEEISGVTEDGGEPEVEEQQQQDAPPRTQRPPDRPRRDVHPPNRLTYPSFGKPKVVRAGSVAEQCDEDEIAHWHKYGPDGELTRYKSRLVAKGFQQTKGKDFDEIFAPMGKGTTLRVMLRMAANRGWRIKQMDITTDLPCVFLGFPLDVPGWQFYHPTSRRNLSSQDVTFDESVYAIEPVKVAVDSGAARGAESAGAGSGGAEPAGAGSGGAEPPGAGPGGAEPERAEPRGAGAGGVEPGVAECGGAEPDGTGPGGPSGASSCHAASAGATSLGGARTGGTGAAGPGGATGAGAAGGAGAGGAAGVGATGGTGAGAAASSGGPAGAGAAGGTGAGGAAGTGAPMGAGVGATRAAGGAAGVGSAVGVGADAGGAGAVPAGPRGAAQPRLYSVPLLQQVLGHLPSSCPAPSLECPLPVQSDSQLQLASPLPAPSPYAGPTGGLAERREPESRPASPVCAARTGRRVPRPRPPPVSGTHQMALRPSTAPQRVPLPSPPESSLPALPDPESDSLHAASSTVTRFLATVLTDPSFESTAASALVAELVDFAAHYRLDYAASLVAESASVCPPSIGGECALSMDVLEDRQEEFQCFAAALPHLVSMLLAPEGDPDAPDIPTPRSYAEVIEGPYSSQWQTAMDAQMASWKSIGTYVDEVPPPGANIVSGMWIFRVKRPPGFPPVFKMRYVARGFNQRQGVDFFQTFSPTLKMTTLRVLLHVAAQRDYELHSLDFSTTFLQGSLHEEIWLRRPPGFTGSTLAALGFAPSTADPLLFLRTDTLLPPFYILVYVDDLVFATADTARLAHVKPELQKRHTCTDLGELRSYLGLQITRDRARRTITLTQSHMVQQVLQRFGFTYSLPQATPLSTRHSLSALPSDESESRVAPRYVAPGRHRPEHMAAAKRVLRYLCSTSGMGLVLGGRSLVVLTGHADASWVDDLATQRSSQGYTFSLGSGSVPWWSTRSSFVLSSSCEAEIYAGAMAAQELRWLTYLLTDLGEQPRSPPVLYIDNKAMLALCREHRLEHRTKHIALRYFLARKLQQRGQLRLAYVAAQANTADIFTKALQPCDHQRFCTMLGLLALLCFA
ncbi:unnamed protein product [Closterium sp. NIES-53]